MGKMPCYSYLGVDWGRKGVGEAEGFFDIWSKMFVICRQQFSVEKENCCSSFVR